MTDHHDAPDPLDVVARYAPRAATLTREWDAVRPDDAVQRIVDDEAGPLRLVPRRPLAHRPLSARVPVLASVGLFGVAAAVLVAVLVTATGGGDGGGHVAPAGGHHQPFDPPPGLSDKSITASQYSYRVTQQISLDKYGTPVADDFSMTLRDYVSPKGSVVSVRTGSQHGCFIFPGSGGSVRSFAKLPTDVAKLTAYLRAHAGGGSSTRDHAVFVAVGDMLRTADGLASPRLRAALVAVLSRTPGVYLHRDDRDYLHRPALRLDFVEQSIEPGAVESLYFDPTDFRLLEERDGHNGAPSTYGGPSPAYDSPAPANGVDPATLSYPASITVMRSERVLDHLPSLSGCRRS